MKEYQNHFMQFHPGITFIYFVTAVIFTVTFTHPAFLTVSAIMCSLYLILLFGIKIFSKNLLYSAPMVLFIIIINPLFNHRGITPILYINDQPITLEAVLYGLFTGLLIICLLFWFKNMGSVIDSYRFLYLFGRFIPTIALMTTMTIRFIPYFRRKLEEIQRTWHTLGVSTQSGKIKYRLNSGIKIMSVLVSVSLENSIDTADSMRARGYNLKKKTHYHTYRFMVKDTLLLGIILVFTILLIMIKLTHRFDFNYYPKLTEFHLDLNNTLILICYGVFLGIPMIYNVLEGLRWHLLTSEN